ncbi:AI-2E family transporter [Flavihumibacter solisilvae]|uniref:AI-2E family transporter n=1 Tax=Flavihumibacter solisilvae TaxID=1349421 RepID=UPI000907C957|nr:AI-2E family transporter [Flavihumibacter solisilvae]
MGPTETPTSRPALISRLAIQVALQLLVLFLLVRFCYHVIAPFVNIIVWAAILAVTIHPLYIRLKKAIGGRSSLSAVLITIAMLLILIGPAIWFISTSAGEVKEVVVKLRTNNLQVPPPTAKVKEWPLIGNRAYSLWNEASAGVDTMIRHYPAQTKRVATKVIGMITSTGKGLLLIAAAIIVSGVMLVYADQAGTFSRSLVNKLTSNANIDLTSIAVVTIRNVVKGILGVAVVQTILAAAGMIVAGIPYAGIWALLCLVLAIIQVGTLPVAIGVIIYAWGALPTLTASLITVWMLVVGILDNILKPIVMGKGAPVPMLVIFLGAIGGFMYSGFIGLFTGAVILSLGYRLFDIWLKGPEI